MIVRDVFAEVPKIKLEVRGQERPVYLTAAQGREWKLVLCATGRCGRGNTPVLFERRCLGALPVRTDSLKAERRHGA